MKSIVRKQSDEKGEEIADVPTQKCKVAIYSKGLIEGWYMVFKKDIPPLPYKQYYVCTTP